MKKLLAFNFIILFTASLISCSKKALVAPVTYSQMIIGKWESVDSTGERLTKEFSNMHVRELRHVINEFFVYHKYSPYQVKGDTIYIKASETLTRKLLIKKEKKEIVIIDGDSIFTKIE